jgi:hypothetical protein
MHELWLDPDYRTQRFRALNPAFPTHVNQLETEREIFWNWYRVQRRKRWLGRILRLWPIALGTLLGLLAPQLRAFLMESHPWGMWVVFPFALLARRPELQFNEQIGRILPPLILYLQFPLEGLAARLALRQHVTVPGVTGQIFYFHFLGALQLVLVSGLLTPLFIR